MKKCKQFFVEYESAKLVCGSYIHMAGNASTLKSAKQLIYCVRKTNEHNPHDFRVYDSWATVCPETNHVPCIYYEI